MSRRVIAIIVILTLVLLILIGSLSDILEIFALEPRVQGYAIYEGGTIRHISEMPFYIVMRNVAAVLFLAWFLTYISYMIKPGLYHDLFGITYGMTYIITHYLYLTFMGVQVVFYPFIYSLHIIGKPLIYLDWGQVIGLITAWRLAVLIRNVRRNRMEPSRFRR